MTISFDFVKHFIIKTACDTTGDEPEELLESGRLEIAPRDAIEFVVRLETTFDCVLGRLSYAPLSVDIDELAFRVLAAREAVATRPSERAGKDGAYADPA
ncbi:DUF6137 domain-containing protein [Paludibacterium paludis]|uniref:Uncharacterized protein n=1 Tax=Paludibacterium paludis TaxID=1225769 RepID=A0A918UBF1_9NEIS|nr:DUF6137 domain-containing protein [Paludibacterium paludis]GGY24620.1 hypothetical protein GCM10011289_30300 [Paludibacterium paludis]